MKNHNRGVSLLSTVMAIGLALLGAADAQASGALDASVCHADLELGTGLSGPAPTSSAPSSRDSLSALGPAPQLSNDDGEEEEEEEDGGSCGSCVNGLRRCVYFFGIIITYELCGPTEA